MSAGTNVTLQFMALFLASMLRLYHPGWVLFLAFSVAPLALLPLIMAFRTLRREQLRPALAVPFVASAASLVAVAALYPEYDDRTWWIPGLPGFAPDGVVDLGTVTQLGNIAAFAYLVALVWTVVAAAPRRRSAKRP